MYINSLWWNKWKVNWRIYNFTTSPLCAFFLFAFVSCFFKRWLSTHFSPLSTILFVNFNFHFYSLFTRESFVFVRPLPASFFFLLLFVFFSTFCFVLFLCSQDPASYRKRLSPTTIRRAANNKLILIFKSWSWASKTH